MAMYGQRRGILDMRVVEARNLQEPNYLSTSDPYAKIKIGATEHQTQVHNNGGRKPKWDCKLPPFIVPNIDADILTIEIFDKDTHTADDFVGRTAINIGQSLGTTSVKDAWYPVTPRGDIRLRTKFTPDGNHTPGVAPSAPSAPVAAMGQPALAQAGKAAFAQVVGVPMAAPHGGGQMYAVDVDGDGRPDYIAMAPAAPAYAAQPAHGWAQPAQAAPAQPQAAYGQPQAAYGQPQAAYGQPQAAYGQPQAAYGHPQAAYGKPQAAYGQPQAAYGQPQAAYGQPQAAYGQPQAAYGQPAQAYAQPVQAAAYAHVQPQAAYGQPAPSAPVYGAPAAQPGYPAFR